MPQPADHLLAQLQRASSDLDSLIQDVTLGVSSTRRYDELEAHAQDIAATIVQTFRGSAARPSTVQIVPGRNGGVWLR